METAKRKKRGIREIQEAVLLNEKLQTLFLRFDHVLSEIEFEQRETEETRQEEPEYW